MNEAKKMTKVIWIIIAIGINVLGKHLALKLNLPLWLDAVGTIWSGMMMGPWIGLTVGFLTNILASLADYITAFYALVNIAMGIVSGILFYKKAFKLSQVFFGALCIAGISAILCIPMNLVFYDGFTGNVIGDGIYEWLSDLHVAKPVCAVFAEMLLELPDKIVATFIAFGLFLLFKKKNDRLSAEKTSVFNVRAEYRRMVIGSVIVYVILVMMLIQAFIIKSHSGMLVSMIVVFIYLCIASAVIILTIWLLTRKITIEREKYENELSIRNEQLQAALKSAEIANKSKTSFLFNMSHDIRTPMNAIMGFTGMAIKHIDDKEKTLDCLSKTQQSGNMLLSLINSVLEVSRIESGNAVLDEKPGDIFNSFATIESTMRELAEDHSIRLSFEILNIHDRYIYCDYSRCMRVLVNVISNAIKYTREGGFVNVTCEQIGSSENGTGLFRYTVEDNGIGMSEEFQKHVFEQFSREKSATVSGIQGSGLGLAVCKSFVDLMGGTIECMSKENEGTTFIITLPFRLQTYNPESLEDNEPSSVIEQSGNANNTSFLGKRVLLVEDNELNSEIAADLLFGEGLSVDCADDGTKAVDLLRERGPHYYDFILMDIQMPVMNGYEATRAIREMYPEAHLPIIALSANAFAEDKKASISAGMDDHVAKPINVKELFDTLAKYL